MEYTARMVLFFVLDALAGPPRAALGTTAILPRTLIEPGRPVSLYLAMENRTDKVLTFEQHVHPACFVAKFAEITLDPPAEPKPLPDCSVLTGPVKPGEVVDMLVDLREVFELTEQPTTVSLQWKDGGPDIYSPLTAIPGNYRFSAPFHQGRIAKGGMIALPDKSTLVFVGHATQPAEQRGQAPKLVIDLIQRVPGKGETPVRAVLQVETQRQFDFGKYRIDLGPHQFDQWMDVAIHTP